jgi:hypothetical protein
VSIHPYREAIASVIFAAAWADGTVADEEKQALDRVLSRLGYSRAEVMLLIGKALEGPRLEPIELPTEAPGTLEVMRYALAVTLADGSLSHTEITFLAQLASHLRLGSEALDALKGEAERLIGGRTASGPTSASQRVEALLPEGKLKLGDSEIEHAPAPHEAVGEDAASRLALSRLLYQGDEFGAELEL